MSDTPGNPTRILLIDDDLVDRRIIRRYIEQSGLDAELRICGDTTSAQLPADIAWAECVILDYRLPGGDAFELMPELFGTPIEQRPGILILTGMGDERIAAEAIRRGAQEYCSKVDLSPSNLRLAIERTCEFAQLQKANASNASELVRLSQFDPLTDLPNRRYLFEALSAMTAGGGAEFAVLMLDLDNFKRVNDELGHAAGDMLLREVAHRFKRDLRETDLIARIGGDEFVVVLVDTPTPAQAEVVARKLIAAAERPFSIHDHQIQIGTSVGAAFFPTHGGNSERILHCADMAMYECKNSPSSFRIFTTGNHERHRERSRIDALARRSAAKLGLEAAYQTVFDTQTRAPVALEALVRWHHPELGLLPPRKFIPAMARAGRIEELTVDFTHVVLEQVSEMGSVRRARRSFDQLVPPAPAAQQIPTSD